MKPIFFCKTLFNRIILGRKGVQLNSATYENLEKNGLNPFEISTILQLQRDGIFWEKSEGEVKKNLILAYMQKAIGQNEKKKMRTRIEYLLYSKTLYL